jgi:outer membrane protein insertion porin family
VPSFEKFFLGGNQNVRGYDYRDIAVYKQDCPGRTNFAGFQKCTGGKTAMFANLEYRFKVMRRSMQLYAFTDFGNVLEDSFEFETEFKQSAGIGFRVRSPMGPINISWSRRLEPTAPDTSDDGETQIDFNIGTGF